MAIERRYAARHRIDHPVYIRYRRRPFLGAQARDVSVGGMFLAVQSLTLPAGTLIDIEVQAHGRRWLLPAVVIHGNPRGIGVMFRDPQPQLFEELTRLPAPATPRQHQRLPTSQRPNQLLNRHGC